MIKNTLFAAVSIILIVVVAFLFDQHCFREWEANIDVDAEVIL
jgi:hypothetical protein